MPFTVLDVIVVVVVLISAGLAMARGFVREVLSVASWVAAVAAAYYLYKSVLPLVKPYFQNTTVASVVSASAVFFVALIIMSFLTMKIADFVIDSRVGAVDRALGFLFGAFRGLLLLVIAVVFFDWLVPTPPGWVADAKTRPMLVTLGERLKEALPADIEQAISKRLGRGTSDASASGDVNPSRDVPADADPGPSDAAKQDLNRLIQNNGAN
jgi:membrane protein required for colicin V production